MISIEQHNIREKAVLVSVELPSQKAGDINENLRELDQLAKTAGLEVVATMIQERQKIDPAYYIGKGKLEELSQLIHSSDSDVVIFDDDLSPAQIRNQEKILEVKIIDRSTLILDIFAKHARTREAKTQVELAQLQYLFPRLTRQWTHLSRQVGGIGARGPGETQLETDRRLIRTRIEKLQVDLRQIDRQRTVRRKNRRSMYRVALIGYTNVGKSTIMNLLSGSDVTVEDQLFATLDSTVRRVSLNREQDILLSDTVGFIRKLPHHLVASFKSTLDEARESDLLLHVVDIRHPRFREQMQTVSKVLEELDAHRKPMLRVFNKIDLLREHGLIRALRVQYPDSVFMSARRHIGIDSLKQKLIERIEENYISVELTFPAWHQRFINYIHNTCMVEEQKYLDSTVILSIRCDKSEHEKIMETFQKLTGNLTE